MESNWRSHKSRQRPKTHNKPTNIVQEGSLISDTPEEAAKKAARAKRFANTPQNQKYGLVSRGQESALQTNKNRERERFFAEIKQRFVERCAIHENSTALRQSIQDIEKNGDIFLDLRKLREALLGLPPSDFTVQVYMFSIRVGARLGHRPSYFPSIGYLLSAVDNKELSLTPNDLDEVVSIYVLHLAHFRSGHPQDLGLCFKLMRKYIPKNMAVRAIVKSVVQNNYVLWFETYSGDLKQNLTCHSVLLHLGVPMMTRRALEVINRVYYKVPREYLEKEVFCGSLDWSEVIQMPECKDWKFDGGQIIVRERRAKA